MNESSVREGWGTGVSGDPVLDGALARAAAALEVISSYDLTALVRLEGPSTGLHAAALEVERLRRSLQGFDTHYVNAVDAGGEPARYAQPSTTRFLSTQLRISPTEAKRRVQAAAACSARDGFGAGPVPPRCWPRTRPP